MNFRMEGINLKNEKIKIDSSDISRLVTDREFWIQNLSGEIVKSKFPYDYNLNEGYEQKEECIETAFSEDISRKILKLSNGSDSRVFMIFDFCFDDFNRKIHR